MNIKFKKPGTRLIGNIRLSEETYEGVKKVAEEQGVHMNEVVRTFVEAALEEYLSKELTY